MGLKNHIFSLFFNLYHSQIGIEVYPLITRELLEDLHENMVQSTKIAKKLFKRNISEVFIYVCFADAQL